MIDFKESLFLRKMRQVTPIGDNTAALLASYLEECHFARKEMILRSGIYCRYAWFVEKGMSRHFWLEESKESVTSFSLEGGVIFSMDEFYYGEVSQEFAQAVEPIDAWRIELSTFERLFCENFELCNWGRLIHQHEYRRLHQSHRERLTLPAAARYEAFKTQFPEVCARAALGDIASYLGIDQSTLSRIRASL